MKKDKIDTFEKLKIQILGLYEEISILSKKSPDKPVNKFKLKFINDILRTANEFLEGEYKAFDDFEEFSDEELPTNSDVIFIISQYIKCLRRYNDDNVHYTHGYSYWIIDGDETEIRATDPSQFNYVRSK